MTKQEEIREGIYTLAIEAVCPNSKKPVTPFEINTVKLFEAFGMQVISYLHSQGGVIKAEKPQPNAILQTVDWDDTLPYTEYVAVVPLVEKELVE